MFILSLYQLLASLGLITSGIFLCSYLLSVYVYDSHIKKINDVLTKIIDKMNILEDKLSKQEDLIDVLEEELTAHNGQIAMLQGAIDKLVYSPAAQEFVQLTSDEKYKTLVMLKNKSEEKSEDQEYYRKLHKMLKSIWTRFVEQ